MRKEVDSVLGAKPDITYDDLTRLEYTGCVFKETLRLWPPGANLHRLADEDLILNGYSIPKGTWIIVKWTLIEQFFNKLSEILI